MSEVHPADYDAASEEARHRFLTEPVVRPRTQKDPRDDCLCLHSLTATCRSLGLPCERVIAPVGGQS